MDEMNTISEHELRERLWAGGSDVDPASLSALADDALRQARRRQRTLRTAATLSVALVVTGVGVTASTLGTHLQRPASVSATSVVAEQHGPVKLSTPIWFLPVVSVAAGACKTGGYTGTSTIGTTTTYCFHVDSAHAMSVSELAEITAGLAATAQPSNGWAVKGTFLDADKAAFTHLTAATVNRELAIVIDGKVVSAPVIEEPITNGTFQIAGYTQQSANNLINQLTGE